MAISIELPASNKNSLVKEWRTIDTKIQSILKKEGDLSQQKLNLELALNEATDNIQMLNKSIVEKRSTVLNRLRYLDSNSGADLIRNLLESTNPGELERNLKYFTIQTQLDIDLVRQYNKEVTKLESERTLLGLRISKLNETQRDLKQEADNYSNELQKKNLILNKMRRRLKSDAKMWGQELLAAKQNNNLDKINLYESLLNKNLLDRKGQLLSPTDFSIKIRYGILKTTPQSPALPFQGVLFESPVGAQVKAIADGTIAWIGSIDGIGDTIILDHGRNFYSIYSRVQLSNKHIGDIIEEGSVFTKVVPSLSQLGGGLYFEIREHGRPTDPLRWILTKQELLTKDSIPWENIQ